MRQRGGERPLLGFGVGRAGFDSALRLPAERPRLSYFTNLLLQQQKGLVRTEGCLAHRRYSAKVSSDFPSLQGRGLYEGAWEGICTFYYFPTGRGLKWKKKKVKTSYVLGASGLSCLSSGDRGWSILAQAPRSSGPAQDQALCLSSAGAVSAPARGHRVLLC